MAPWGMRARESNVSEVQKSSNEFDYSSLVSPPPISVLTTQTATRLTNYHL